ncbi:MAG: hypothetical protein MRJ68_02125 [Nitrospira sp.]|nr:hypothetical protein [Nitrospira sp.]
MRLEVLRPLHIRRLAGGEDLHLKPGSVADLPDEDALSLLAKKPDAVRLMRTSGTVIEPAIRPDGQPLSPVYWEAGTGEILGPATPEYFARHGHSDWIVITFEGQPRWIHADRLRSRKAFETQRSSQIVEWVREPR